MDAQEVDMDRLIPDWIELHIARQRAMHRAADIDVEKAREEAGLLHFAAQLARVARYHGCGFALAIEHSANATRATGGPGGPFSGPVTRLGAQGNDVSHLNTPLLASKGDGLQGCRTPVKNRMSRIVADQMESRISSFPRKRESRGA